MTIITLTTDFGLIDGYVGIMKGVILGIAPASQLVDLSHEIAAQDVEQAAYVLARAIPYFPPGTVHLVVVDPGVGSDRRALVVQTPQAAFVGPDNGVFSAPLADAGASVYAADRPEYWLTHVSQTFHGRDIFAPLAAHLASGVTPGAVGSPISDPVRLPSQPPQRLPDGTIKGRVVHVDRFGNLITDMPGAWLAEGAWEIALAGKPIGRLSRAYADAPPGAVVALVSSGGTLEIAVRNGSAGRVLAASAGQMVTAAPSPIGS